MNSRIDELRKELAHASDVYYNSGEEVMSNKEYDDKLAELQELERAEGITDGFSSKVGASVNGKLPKVKHEFRALSLDKSKDADKIASVHNTDAEVVLSWKLDGSTVQATYENGKLKLLATRGDGEIGQDITQNALYIASIPKKISDTGKLVVRGEAVMTHKEFARINENDEFANARNLANATITALDESILMERRVCFRPFELVYSENTELDTFSKRLDYLNSLGFVTVPYEKTTSKDLKSTIEKWSERADKYEFPVDGLVVCAEDVEGVRDLKGTEHHPHPRKGMAFKWQDETAKTTLREIRWQIGRTGVLTPIAVFDEVNLAGTKVGKASLFNLSYLASKDLRVGDTITVYKANMIIPQVGENLSAAGRTPLRSVNYDHPLTCPCCNKETTLQYSERGILSLTCENPKCMEKELNRFSYFVSKNGMNVEGLSEHTLRKLMKIGVIKDFSDIFNLKDSPVRLDEIERLGEAKVANLFESIEKAREVDFNHFMYACGIEEFGKKQIKILKEYLESPSIVAEYGDDEYNLVKMMAKMVYVENGYPFDKIEGIGQICNRTLNEWVKENLVKPYYENSEPTAVSRLLEEVYFTDKPYVKEDKVLPFDQKTFCITGSLTGFANRDECIAFIEKNGGKFVSGVTKKTDYLVNNDTESTSGKNKKAKELGIPIISETELISLSSYKKETEKKKPKVKDLVER